MVRLPEAAVREREAKKGQIVFRGGGGVHPPTATVLLGHQASLEPATSPPRTIKKENTWPAGESSNERVLAGTHWVTSRTLNEFPSGFKSRKPRGEKNLSLCPSS